MNWIRAKRDVSPSPVLVLFSVSLFSVLPPLSIYVVFTLAHCCLLFSRGYLFSQHLPFSSNKILSFIRHKKGAGSTFQKGVSPQPNGLVKCGASLEGERDVEHRLMTKLCNKCGR